MRSRDGFLAPAQARTAVVEATEAWRSLAGGPREFTRVLVTLDGRPCGSFAVPGDAGPGLMAATAGRRAARWAAERDARERLRRRLGSPPPACQELTVSVVVCTHRRPKNLSRLLASVAGLDPSPAEVIVVDNDPGQHSAEDAAVVAGARYIREPARGLNIARATGLRAACGDVVAFVDDDCVVPPGWLRDLPVSFADATVGALTGPLYAYELRTDAQVMRERIASFDKGVRERRFDWTGIWAVHSGRVGTGANMIFRRQTLLEIEDAFPPELDAGTPTASGGDLYALYKVIAAGHRIVYEPSAYTFHRHGETFEAMRSTAEGYGTGLAAHLSRALVVDREPATLALWRWLWRRWLRVALDWTFGYGDVAAARWRGHYLIGGLKGPIAWVCSRRDATRGRRAGPVLSGPAAARRGEQPARTGAGRADGGSSRAAIIHAATTLEANRLAQAADADVLVFVTREHGLDRDVGPAHAALHTDDGKARLVVGRTVGVMEKRSLTALAARFEVEDEQRLAREAAAATFADITEGNVSVRRDTFMRLGGLASGFDLRTGLRDLGLRALASGVDLVHAHDAIATLPLPSDPAQLFARARRAGRGDRMLVERHPAVAGALPARTRPSKPVRRHAAAAAVPLLRSARVRQAIVPALGALERLRLRRIWVRLAWVGVRGAYEEGLGPARRRVEDPGARPIRIDLHAVEAIPPPRAVTGPVEVAAGDDVVACARPPGGHWHHDFLEPFVVTRAPKGGRYFPPMPPAAAAVPPADRSERALADVEAVVGARTDPGQRRDLEVAGAAVTDASDAHPAEHWRSVASTLATSGRELVAFALPGVSFDAAAVAAVLPAFESRSSAAVLVVGVADREPPSPLLFWSPNPHRSPYARPGLPAQLLLVRRSACVGLIDPRLAALGAQAPCLDLVERLLAADRAIAYAEVPGIEPALDPGARRRFAARSAAAALVCRDGIRIGGMRGAWHVLARGAAPRVRGVWRVATGEGTVSGWLGGTAAFAHGCANAVARQRSLPSADVDSLPGPSGARETPR